VKKYLPLFLLALGGCATAPMPKVVQVPVPVQVPCPKPVLPPKPNLSSLAALKPTDPPQRVMEVMTAALAALAKDDQELRVLLGN
jgi:hypothetical protein